MTSVSLYSSYNYTTAAVFTELDDQLASLERHAYLTRCFSAVAELKKKKKKGKFYFGKQITKNDTKYKINKLITATKHSIYVSYYCLIATIFGE